jgi:hypothetical protein
MVDVAVRNSHVSGSATLKTLKSLNVRWIWIKANLQIWKNKHRTKTGKQNKHRTKTRNQNKQLHVMMGVTPNEEIMKKKQLTARFDENA